MRATWMMSLACLVAAGLLAVAGCNMAVHRAKCMGANGYWTFDEGTGETVENAIGPNDGTVQGGLEWTDGKRGKALAFNGAGYVLINSADYLNAKAYTFAAWVKLEDTGDYQYIVWRGGPAFPEAEECRNLDIWVTMEGTLSGILDYKDETEPRLHLTGTTRVTDDRWHLVVCVNDGQTVRFYVDGKQDAEAALAGPLDESEHPLWIGARPADVAATGIIDEVRFFDTALTAEQVAELD